MEKRHSFIGTKLVLLYNGTFKSSFSAVPTVCRMAILQWLPQNIALKVVTPVRITVKLQFSLRQGFPIILGLDPQNDHI